MLNKMSGFKLST